MSRLLHIFLLPNFGRFSPLLLSLLIWVSPSANAEKLTEEEVQKIAATINNDLRRIPSLFSEQDRKDFDFVAIRDCADKLVLTGLRKMELKNPAAPTDSDFEQIGLLQQGATKSCSRPYYKKIQVRADTAFCYRIIRNHPDFKDKGDAQLHRYCDCTGKKYGELSDNSLDPMMSDGFDPENFKKAATSCNAILTENSPPQ